MERWFLQKDEWEEPVKLPRIAYFKATKKESSPYDRLYRWTLNKLFPMSDFLYGNEQQRAEFLVSRGFTVSNVWLHYKDMAKMKKLVENWATKCHKVSKGRLKSTVALYDLGHGPGEFRLDQDYQLPDWIKPGHVYIRKISK